MAKKKAKPGTLGLVMIAIGLAGAVFAVVGLFVSWFAMSGNVVGLSKTEFYGLFHDFGNLPDRVFPLVVVQIFGIIAVVTAVAAAAVLLLRSYGRLKISGFAKLLVSAFSVLTGVLALVFTFLFVGSMFDAPGVIVNVGYAPAYGAFFTGVGAIVVGGALLLKK